MAYEYLGTALEYPIRIVNGRPAIASGIRVIENSIIKILTTPVGSRFFLREYGCRIDRIIFEPNDEILLRMLRAEILLALSKWETRAKFLDVFCVGGTLPGKGDVVLCVIKYQVLPSNEINSFVYPIYKSLVW